MIRQKKKEYNLEELSKMMTKWKEGIQTGNTYLESLYNNFNNDHRIDPLHLVQDFVEATSWSEGYWYLGGQMKLTLTDKITNKMINSVRTMISKQDEEYETYGNNGAQSLDVKAVHFEVLVILLKNICPVLEQHLDH